MSLQDINILFSLINVVVIIWKGPPQHSTEGRENSKFPVQEQNRDMTALRYVSEILNVHRKALEQCDYPCQNEQTHEWQ